MKALFEEVALLIVVVVIFGLFIAFVKADLLNEVTTFILESIRGLMA